MIPILLGIITILLYCYLIVYALFIMLCVNIALDKKFYNLVISDIDSNLTITILSVNIITFILYFSYINLFKLL